MNNTDPFFGFDVVETRTIPSTLLEFHGNRDDLMKILATLTVTREVVTLSGPVECSTTGGCFSLGVVVTDTFTAHDETALMTALGYRPPDPFSPN